MATGAPWTEGTMSSFWSLPTSNANLTGANSTQGCLLSADFQYIMFPVVYSLVFVLGTTSNAAALWFFFRTKETLSPSDVFMVNLAAIDLVFALTLPFRIVYHALGNEWTFGEWGCKITGSLFFANLYGSSLFLTCICVDRYIAVVHPLRSLALRRPRYRVLVCLAVWLVLAACILYLMLKGPLTSHFPDGRTACLENFSSGSWSGRISSISIVGAVIGFFMPVLVIAVCYSLIARRLLEPTAGNAVHAVKRRALRTVLVVLCVFLVCFVPYHVVQLVHTLLRLNPGPASCRIIRFTYSARRVTMALTSLNSCLDPLIYSLGRRFSPSPRAWCCGRRRRASLTITFRSKETTRSKS
ncbi:lysophosphatidic acid receptor 6-like [Leucoraja erinacea]|uniref:lysophosphatidic acid receptor 6-like n=1 Tax=Leucoraja erinaceus TaxID=7782 RepID=UPI002454E18A|nr:lysophosphatidic acid receptor 6-like [Leucoraja erinacea]XP_055521337.1 lysophosphatidic acid receptor 6-like [Leucoraja erinacea]